MTGMPLFRWLMNGPDLAGKNAGTPAVHNFQCLLQSVSVE